MRHRYGIQLGNFYESEEKKAVDGGYFNNIIYICKNYVI